MADWSSILAVALPSFGVLTPIGAWGIRTSQRLSQHDTLFEEREKQADERFEYIKVQLSDIKAAVDKNEREQIRTNYPHA